MCDCECECERARARARAWVGGWVGGWVRGEHVHGHEWVRACEHARRLHLV